MAVEGRKYSLTRLQFRRWASLTPQAIPPVTYFGNLRFAIRLRRKKMTGCHEGSELAQLISIGFSAAQPKVTAVPHTWDAPCLINVDISVTHVASIVASGRSRQARSTRESLMRSVEALEHIPDYDVL